MYWNCVFWSFQNNRLAKLKQSKLDVRREQWLSQGMRNACVCILVIWIWCMRICIELLQTCSGDVILLFVSLSYRCIDLFAWGFLFCCRVNCESRWCVIDVSCEIWSSVCLKYIWSCMCIEFWCFFFLPCWSAPGLRLCLCIILYCESMILTKL